MLKRKKSWPMHNNTLIIFQYCFVLCAYWEQFFDKLIIYHYKLNNIWKLIRGQKDFVFSKMVPISYLWIQYLGHCKLCKYSPDENIIDMWKKIIIIPILRLWSRVGLTSECLFWWVQIRYWKKCHLKRTSLQDFVMIIIFQISTDAETGKTRVSRINGHVHSIPGKEVRRDLRPKNFNE